MKNNNDKDDNKDKEDNVKNIVNKCEREPMYSTSPDDCNRTDAPYLFLNISSLDFVKILFLNLISSGYAVKRVLQAMIVFHSL